MTRPAYVHLTAADVHPSHQMFDEGWVWPDPRCAVCRHCAEFASPEVEAILRGSCPGAPVHPADDMTGSG